MDSYGQMDSFCDIHTSRSGLVFGGIHVHPVVFIKRFGWKETRFLSVETPTIVSGHNGNNDMEEEFR